MEHQMEEEKLNFELEIILDMEIMGKICSMFFAFIENICFYLPFLRFRSSVALVHLLW